MEETCPSVPELDVVVGSVPSFVSCIHELLTGNVDVSAQHRLDETILQLTHTHTQDVVVTLLRQAPSCDRAAATMWRAMVSERRTAEKVLLELLYVLQEWPLHSTTTSDGDSTEIFALAATRALWEILQLPRTPDGLMVHFPALLLALLHQVFFSTQYMPEEVDAFWRGIQPDSCLPTSPNRFAVMTIKALLCRIEWEHVVLAVERKRGWDTLLNAETHHCAIGLLARELRGTSIHLCDCIAHYLIKVLSSKEPCWEVPSMAFLVELLGCHKLRKWGGHVLHLIPRYLQSKCSVMRHLVLRLLIALCKRPSMAKAMDFLLPWLVELLQEADREVVGMTLSVVSKVVRHMDMRIDSDVAVQLAEKLQPLFENDANNVKWPSICLFRDVMEFVEGEGKQPLKPYVHQSLLPLFILLHDENQRVAEASRETLLQATKFLKKRKLRVLLKREQTWAVSKCLLAENSSRVDEYLSQSLRYLQSPQDSLREAAIRFIGLAGQHMMGQQEKLQRIYEALEGMTNDNSHCISYLAAQTLVLLKAAERNPSFRFRLQVSIRQLWGVWRRRLSLRGSGELWSWSSEQS